MSKTTYRTLSAGQKMAEHRRHTERQLRWARNADGSIRSRRGTPQKVLVKPRRRGFDGTLRSSVSNRLREIQINGR